MSKTQRSVEPRQQTFDFDALLPEEGAGSPVAARSEAKVEARQACVTQSLRLLGAVGSADEAAIDAARMRAHVLCTMAERALGKPTDARLHAALSVLMLTVTETLKEGSLCVGRAQFEEQKALYDEAMARRAFEERSGSEVLGQVDFDEVVELLCSAGFAARAGDDNPSVFAGGPALLKVERDGDETLVYTQKSWAQEEALGKRLAELAIDTVPQPAASPETEAERAGRLALANRLTVISGGPGTGKTTVMSGILRLFDALRLKTQLAAPTGRAAKRLSEVTGREASTIHRLLEAQFDEATGRMAFFHDEDAPLACDAMIVDETSMVDLQLMLLKALKPGCRLLLVGDPDQLPPVGAGNVFSDLIRSGVVQTVRLTEIFRQAQRSLIVMNAHAVNQGELPVLTATDRDFFFLRRRDPAAAVKTIQELCQTRLPKNMGIQPSDIQVLSPSRKHETGTKALNLALQAVLNPPAEGKKEKKHGDFSFRTGDRVMQIRNNYDIMWKRADGLGAGTGIFNGDIGTVTDIDFQEETMTIQFDDRTAEYAFDMLSELEPAYAMTVHKSQGSEYRAVILSLCGGPQMLLTRSVLYTAITRARELLIIVGNEETVAAMTRNDRRQRRYSGLKLRLEGKA
jgi:RecD/TraA family predicted helicase